MIYLFVLDDSLTRLRFITRTEQLTIVRHINLEYQPKRAISSIENVFAFFERGYIVHYKTK